MSGAGSEVSRTSNGDEKMGAKKKTDNLEPVSVSTSHRLDMGDFLDK